LTLKIDPIQGVGTRIFLHGNPKKFEKSSKATLTLRELTGGPHKGGLEMILHTSYHAHYRRILPADQWQNGWDGTVRLRLGPKWIAVALGDDFLMRISREGNNFMLAITPGGVRDKDGGNVTLHSIVGGWVTPDGLTGVERMRLSDTEDFDPDAFLGFLAVETGVPAE